MGLCAFVCVQCVLTVCVLGAIVETSSLLCAAQGGGELGRDDWLGKQEVKLL